MDVWRAFTQTAQQTWAVTRVGLSTIPQRLGPCAVIIVGTAGVVGVLVTLLAMGTGFESTLKQTGSDDTALVLQAGAQSEASSTIPHDVVALASQAPQILRNAQGQPIASSDLLLVASLAERNSGHSANVAIRGVGAHAWELRPRTRIVEGRKFRSGLNELLVGRGVHHQFAGADMGSTIRLNGQAWTVVGVFDSDDAHNSEIWADADVVAAAFRRGRGRSSLAVRLAGASAFDAFKAGLTSDPRLKVDVQTTRQFYNRQSAGLTRLARILGATVGAIMALGAVFGALNTMYSAVAARARDIATFRAIGFNNAPVVVSVLLETVMLATLGGILGAAMAWLIFDGYAASTLGTNGQVMFAFHVSSKLLWTGLRWALVIGLAGGFLPALQAARTPIPAGLRAT